MLSSIYCPMYLNECIEVIPVPCSLSLILLYRVCGLVVRVPGYRSGGPGFDSRALQEKKK
jgi:hypothetical protein